jgi:hypothetical protein
MDRPMTEPIRPAPPQVTPDGPTTAAAGDQPGEPQDPGEPAAWAEVQARWDEPTAHQAYLARFADLAGLATAGGRYRDALGARPGDAVALAMKAEVLKRATVIGLAMLPRTPPPRIEDGRLKRTATLLLASWLAGTLAWLFWKLFTGRAP